MAREQERAELHRVIWQIANDLRGAVQTSGTDIGKILPPMSMFDRDNNRAQKKKTVIEKIVAFFERFFSISE